MANLPYEAPRKIELIDKVAIALDAAGFTAERNPPAIEYPDAVHLQGGIRGDLRAMEGRTTVIYCIRNEWERSLPSWLQEWARAAQAMDMVRFYVVVEQVSASMKSSCEASGAGLLQLVEGSDYQLEQVVDPDDFAAEAREASFSRRLGEARRRLIDKAELLKDAVRENYAAVNLLTDRLEADDQTAFAEEGERKHGAISQWMQRLDAELDRAGAGGSENELSRIEGEIETGPGVDLSG